MARSKGEEKDNGSHLAEDRSGDADEAAGFLPELLRRGLTLGFSGLFVTEEAVRRAFGDTVPREWVEFATGQSERTRSEFFDRLSREIGQAIQSVDVAEAMGKLLEGHTVEVTTRIRLLPDEKEKGPTPTARASSSRKRK